MPCGTMPFIFLLLIGTSYVTMNTSHVSMGLLKEAMKLSEQLKDIVVPILSRFLKGDTCYSLYGIFEPASSTNNDTEPF